MPPSKGRHRADFCADRSLLSVKNILEFADCANLDDVRDLLNRQVLCNCAISAVGIAYMLDKPYDVICRTITNTIATIGGMVCDGAKSSCAAKIAAAVECALVGLDMACDEQTFQPGEGLVKDDVESTIQSIGRMGRVGMHETDIEILNIMLGK